MKLKITQTKKLRFKIFLPFKLQHPQVNLQPPQSSVHCRNPLRSANWPSLLLQPCKGPAPYKPLIPFFIFTFIWPVARESGILIMFFLCRITLMIGRCYLKINFKLSAFPRIYTQLIKNPSIRDAIMASVVTVYLSHVSGCCIPVLFVRSCFSACSIKVCVPELVLPPPSVFLLFCSFSLGNLIQSRASCCDCQIYICTFKSLSWAPCQCQLC